MSVSCNRASMAISPAAVPAGPAVSPSDLSVSRVNVGSVNYARVQYASDGTEASNSNGLETYGVSRGDWLDSGSAGDVWAQVSVASGTPPNYDPDGIVGARRNLGTSRDFGYTQTGVGSISGTVTVTFYDAALGGNVLGSATFLMSATVTS